MKHFADFQYNVEDKDIKNFLENVRSGIPDTPDKELLTLLFSILDLTSLSEKDNAENIE